MASRIIPKLLIVEDEKNTREGIARALKFDYHVEMAENAETALQILEDERFDLVLTDVKMPGMDGVTFVGKAAKIDPQLVFVVMTAYGTVETAVECMKFGAMDYVQKPFTEDELLDFTKKSFIKRADRISKLIKPKVHITHFKDSRYVTTPEFLIPGGVFISKGHCWARVDEDGSVQVGIDDFAKKIIGRIDAIDLPNLGMIIKKGQPLFSVTQGPRLLSFKSPISGKVSEVNTFINNEVDSLNVTVYDRNWICEIDAEELDAELPDLKIGKSAVSFYQEEIEKCKEIKKKIISVKEFDTESTDLIYCGEMEKMDDTNWKRFAEEFFEK